MPTFRVLNLNKPSTKPKQSEFRRYFSNGCLMLLSLVVGSFAPPVITWDSYLYLGSGYGLFRGLIEYQYHWLREPGYPAFIDLLVRIDGIRLVVLVQTALIMAGIILLMGSIDQIVKSNSYKKRNSIIILVFLLTWGFGTTILQQALVFFLFSLLLRCITSPRKKNILKFVGLASILVLIELISTVYFFGAAFAVTMFTFLQPNHFRKKIIGSLLIPLAVLLPALGTFASWEIFKNHQQYTKEIYQDSTEFWKAQPYNNFNFGQKILAVPSTFLALNSLGVEFYYANFNPVASESSLFATPIFSKGDECGKLFPGPQKYIEEAILPALQACVPFNSMLKFSQINRFGSILISLMSWIGFLSILNMFRTRNVKLSDPRFTFLIFPFFVEVPFLFSNAAISRLGFPSTVIFITLGIQAVFGLVDKYKKA